MTDKQNIKKPNFQDLNSIDGLQFIPVNDKKIPIVKGWQTLFKKHNLSENYEATFVLQKQN